MTKTTIVFFSLLTTFSVSAQEVVSTQGDSHSNASANIDFTIGEVIVNKAIIDLTALANSGSGLAINSYWSSTEYDSNLAGTQYFGTGSQVNASKDGSNYYVRSVRAF
jgi:hypothetical protein